MEFNMGVEINGMSIEWNAVAAAIGVLNVIYSNEVETGSCGVSTSLEIT